jgi:hypothetical protein
MRRTILTLASSLLAVAASAADNGGSNPGTNPGQVPPGMDAAAMAKMMELMKPGPEHQQMAKMVGSWDVDGKMWMDPKAPPTDSKGTAQFSAIFDGRYIRQDFQGSMMGMPFTGIGIDGYDRGQKLYTTVWIDSMSTSTFTCTGTASADGKTITYTGDMWCPQTNGMIKSRSVMTLISDSEMTFEMFVTMNGHEDKSMELHYHRKAQAK